MRFKGGLLCAGLLLLAPELRAGADLKDSIVYYRSAVAKGASAEEREDILGRILSNPAFAKSDLTKVKAELRYVQSRVAFAESLEYYQQRVQTGAGPEDRIPLLEKIISKYGKYGFNMTGLKNELAGLKAQMRPAAPLSGGQGPQAQPEASKPLQPPVPVSPAEQEKSFAWTLSFFGGLHAYPGGTFFDKNAAFFKPADFSGLAGFAGFGMEFTHFSWALEGGGYGKTVNTFDFSGGTPLAGQFHIETTVVRITPLAHFTPRDFPVDLALGGGVGAYIWKLTSEITAGSAAPAQTKKSGTVFGYHGTARIAWNITPAYSLVLEDTYAAARVADPFDLNATDQVIDFGGNTAGLGVVLKW